MGTTAGIIGGFDGSEWDASMPWEITKREVAAWGAFGVPSKIIRAKEADLVEGVYSFGRKRGRLHVHGKRRSGDVETSIGNGVANLALQLMAVSFARTGTFCAELRERANRSVDSWPTIPAERRVGTPDLWVTTEGDDALLMIAGEWGPIHQSRYERFVLQAGIRPKLELATPDQDWAPEFCAMHFVAPKHNAQVPLPAMARVLRKFPITTKVQRGSGQPAGYGRLKAASLACLYAQVPLLRELAEAGMSLCPKGRVTQAMVEKAGSYQLWGAGGVKKAHEEIIDVLMRRGRLSQIDEALAPLVGKFLGLHPKQLSEERQHALRTLAGFRRSEVV